MRQSAPWLQHRPPAGTPVRLSKVSQPMGPRLLGSRAHRDGRPAGYPPRSPFCHGRPWPEEGSSLTCSPSQAHGCPRTRGGPGDRGQATNPERVPVPPHESQLGVPLRRPASPAGLPARHQEGRKERGRWSRGSPGPGRVFAASGRCPASCATLPAPPSPRPAGEGRRLRGHRGSAQSHLQLAVETGLKLGTTPAGSHLPPQTHMCVGVWKHLCSTQAAPTSAARLGGVFVPFTFLYR